MEVFFDGFYGIDRGVGGVFDLYEFVHDAVAGESDGGVESGLIWIWVCVCMCICELDRGLAWYA